MYLDQRNQPAAAMITTAAIVTSTPVREPRLAAGAGAGAAFVFAAAGLNAGRSGGFSESYEPLIPGSSSKMSLSGAGDGGTNGVSNAGAPPSATVFVMRPRNSCAVKLSGSSCSTSL